MKEKLLDLMKHEGLKPSQLAEILEVNPAGISHILAGRNKRASICFRRFSEGFRKSTPTGCCLIRRRCTATNIPAYRRHPLQRPPRNFRSTMICSGRSKPRPSLRKPTVRNRRLSGHRLNRPHPSFRSAEPEPAFSGSYCFTTIKPSKVSSLQSAKIFHSKNFPKYTAYEKLIFKGNSIVSTVITIGGNYIQQYP